jgi:hypothetical protein
MPTGRVRPGKEDERWFRCPFCGDSPSHPKKMHFSVNRQGMYHCFRCRESGRLNPESLAEIWPLQERLLPLNVRKDLNALFEPWEDLWSAAVPGPGTPRASLLKRYHCIERGSLLDLFQMRLPNGSQTGVHLRGGSGDRKVSLSQGLTTFGYVREGSLVGYNLRLVEGPYDVLYPEDVCTFGLPHRYQLEQLRMYPVLFCPDGDLWEKDVLFQVYLARIKRFFGGPILGLEYIPGGKDPDEVPVEERIRIPGSTLQAAVAQQHWEDVIGTLREAIGYRKEAGAWS